MTIQEFFKQWDGKFNNYDNTYGPQCKDVFSQYNNDVLGNPYIVGNPIVLWDHPMPGFEKIKNTPINFPKLGDVVIWNLGTTGHLGICQSANPFNLTCFQQNNPIGSPCHFMKTGYKNVLGWFRPIPKPKKFVMEYTVYNGDPTLMEQARQLLVSYSDKVDCVFTYKTVPTESGIFTQDKQIQFIKTHSTTPFVFYFYNSGLRVSQIATGEVPTTKIVMSCATPFDQKVLNVTYELVNALYSHFGKFGDDIFAPNEDFVKQKLTDLLPTITQMLK